jgi:chromosome segregation ATPase
VLNESQIIMQLDPPPNDELRDEEIFAREKARWEVRKLQLETAKLARPFLREPTSWLGLAALALSLSGNLIQFSSAERLRQLAEIRKERLELEAINLEQKTKQLEAAISAQDSVLQAARVDRAKLSAELSSLKSDIQANKVSKDELLKQIQLLLSQMARV